MIKMKMPEFPDINELWATLDIDKVYAKMHDDRVQDTDMRDARSLVARACEVWLPRDFVDFNIDGVEKRFEVEIGNYTAKGFVDLTGTLRGNIPVLSEYAGKRAHVDWKTTKNRFTTEWKTRNLDSWQWKMYCMFEPADIFIYRGINRYGDTKEVMQLVPDWKIEGMPVSEYEVRKQLDLMVRYLTMLEDDEGPWLRNMPSSCYAFKKMCPHYEGSCEACDFPKWKIDPKNRPKISYSLMNDFMLCQERLRRRLHEQAELPNARHDDIEHAVFGNVIHNGLAEIYTQIFDVPQNEKEKHATKTKR